MVTLLITLSLILAVAGNTIPAPQKASSCTYSQKVAGIQHEIDTITSHSYSDANQIPLAPLATRTFYITPTELGGNVTLPPVNVGVTADTVRIELVELATALNAAVPKGSVNYLPEAKNGSVTVDFIQTDRIALPYSHVREIHYFNSGCEITQIVGFVHGNLICPTNSTNTVITQLCAEEEAITSGSG